MGIRLKQERAPSANGIAKYFNAWDEEQRPSVTQITNLRTNRIYIYIYIESPFIFSQ